MHKFTEEQIIYIKKIAKGKQSSKITELFNKKFNLNLKVSQIQSFKANHNVKSGVDCRFKKGNIPANKGKKGSMSPEQYEKCKATMFKKGSIPPNHKPIGSERITKDGIMIKIKDGQGTKNWTYKSRYIYEQTYGKIPKGHKIVFADGDHNNIDLNNLILVSNQEELIMNRYKLIKKDAELTKTGRNIAKLINEANLKTQKIKKEKEKGNG